MVLNLKTKAAQSIIANEGLDNEVRDSADILNFCRTLNGSLLRYGSHDLLIVAPEKYQDDHGVFIKKNNALFYVGDVSDVGYGSYFDRRVSNTAEKILPASAILVSCPKRMPKQKEFRVLILINADDEYATFNGHYGLVDWNTLEFPMVSFSALTHFYGDNIQKVHSALGKGKLRLLDYTPDERIKYTDKEKRERRKKKPNLTPPKIGFSATRSGWHRSGFCLFYDESKKICLLSGQDEGSYFIVELPSKVDTIDQAMDVLIPKEARVPGTIRQGEWFFVPCKADDVPLLHDTILLIDAIDGVHLPLDDIDSNRHIIETSDGRVGKDGRLYLYDPLVSHDEHETVNFDGWCYVVKNTAVRSYSESGVD